jgi:hypothetical protein
VLLEILFQPLPVFSCHWYPDTAPVAATLNDVELPEQTEPLEGCVLMVNELAMVSETVPDVSVLLQPPLLETIQRY